MSNIRESARHMKLAPPVLAASSPDQRNQALQLAADSLLAHKEEISHDVLANDIVTGKTEGYTKEWSINKEQVKLGVEKVQEGNA